MDADKRTVFVALEQGMLATPFRVARARIIQQISSIRILSSTVFAQFAHGLSPSLRCGWNAIGQKDGETLRQLYQTTAKLV